jgi:glycosyltransferase involved in cell wall biosynthesis
MMTSMPEPLISIGIPTYNRVAELDRAIESALSQDYKNLEVIVSDNGSSDSTEDLCRRFAARDGRIRYFRQPANRGATENFRFVLRQAIGELFIWLGDDDWLEPTYLSRCAAVLLADSSYSVVCGLDRYFVESVLDCVGPKIDLESNQPADRVLDYFRTVGRNGMLYGVMRRALISTIPLDDTVGADWLMIAGMAYLGKIRMLEDTYVNRSIAGVSSETSSLSAMYNLSGYQRSNPHWVIACNAFGEIGWRSALYEGLGRAGRLMLAGRVFRTIVRRYYSGRQVLELVRQTAGLSVSEWRTRARAPSAGGRLA